MTARIVEKYEEVKLVRWDPVIARFEENKLRN